MTRWFVTATLIALNGPVLAQVPPAAERTASWYQAHPDALARVTAACRNDPGHGHDNPDCINADAARTNIAADEARRHAGFISPATPQYWRLHPQELPFQLRICARLRPEFQAGNFCDAARNAAKTANR